MARGRPRKIINENTILKEINVMETKQVHVVVRFLSRLNRSNIMTGEISGEDLDALLSKWVTDGYIITQALHLGDNPEGHGLVFVLQKEV